MISVRFFRSPEGKRVAYTEAGEGQLVVLPPWWVSHLERDAEVPAYLAFFARLAEHFRVVRYDRVGVGMSDRDRCSYSLEAEVADLEALVDHLGEKRLNLLALSCGVPVALAYAARHPDRVERLVLYAGYLDGSELAPPEMQSALTALVRAHWGLGSGALADLFYGKDPDARRRFKTLQRAGADAETAARLLELTFSLDAQAYVHQLRTPILVLHRRGDRVIRYEHGLALAATLPGAELVTFEGSGHMPWDGDCAAVVDAATSFLRTGQALAEPAPAGSSELRRDGEVWTVCFSGRKAQLGNGKGIVDLSHLLAHPGEDVHVLDLVGGSTAARIDAGGGDAALDRAALTTYRQRLAEIALALDDKDECGEEDRMRLESEQESILHRLRADLGMGGRARRLNDPVERARKAVTARLRDAIRRISAAHPELGRHLDESITTGVHCAYRPLPETPWIVSPDPI